MGKSQSLHPAGLPATAAAGETGNRQARRNAVWNAGLSLAAAGIVLICGIGLMAPALDTGKVVAHIGFVSTELSTSSENGLQLGLMARDCTPGTTGCPYLAIEYKEPRLKFV